MAHQIGAAAWPVALVLMALLEVGTRIAIVQLRGRAAMQSSAARSPPWHELRGSWIKPFRPASGGPVGFYRPYCGDRSTAERQRGTASG